MMRRRILRSSVVVAGLASALWLVAIPVAAQHHDAWLSMEGVHQRNVHSATAAGVAGLSMLIRDDAAQMLQNPASLASVTGIQLSLGGVHRSIDRSQVQQYAPVRYYPNLSLLLEGLTVRIPDPDPDLIGFTPADSVQRPPDDIGPNWANTLRSTAPLQGFVAVPVDLGSVNLVAGVGVVEYGNFDYYYQNNNVLSPHVLSQRPLPTPRPTDDNPVEVEWYQIVRSRQGSVAGYGGALAVEWERHNLAFGLSATFLSGTTDDFERDHARGHLTFFANAFRVDTLHGGVTRQGWSEFSGLDLAFSSTLSGSNVAASFTIRPAMTITRSFRLDVLDQEAGSSIMQGEETLSLPWRGTAGLALMPRDDFRFGLEYELRPFADALVSDGSGQEHHPWMSANVLRLGAEYAVLPWLSLRGGMRRQSEPFGAEGRAIEDESVWFTAYTAGAGVSLYGAQLNLAFEHRDNRYEDVMGSAIHFNRDMRQMIIADLRYTFDWSSR